MPQKHSNEYIRHIIEDLMEWKWLDNIYQGSKIKLNCICNKNHNIKIKFNHINDGCYICNKEDRNEKIRLDNYLNARSIAESKNWEMLSDESDYKEYGSKLKIRADCEYKHEFETSYSCLKSEINCPICSKNKKLTDEQVKIAVEDRGWKFNFTERNDGCLKINCNCDRNHNISVRYGNIKNKQECLVCCGFVILQEDVEEIVKARGWKLLSEYTGGRDKLKCLCDKGHPVEMILRKIKENLPCPSCSLNFGIAKSIDEVKSIIDSYGLELLNEENYKNEKSQLIVKCKEKGHVIKTTFLKLKTAENKCKKCFSKTSYSEKIVKQYLEEITSFEWKKDRPNWLNYKNSTNKHFNLEIDCYCIELNAGVEVDGKQHYEYPNHYHKTIEDFNDQQNRDDYKIQKFAELNKILIKIRALDYYDSIDEMLYYLEEELIKNKLIKEEQRKHKDFLKTKTNE